MKKEWGRPRLVVLSRGNPEEAILTTCKGTGATGGPVVAESGCIQNGLFCAACEMPVDS